MVNGILNKSIQSFSALKGAKAPVAAETAAPAAEAKTPAESVSLSGGDKIGRYNVSAADLSLAEAVIGDNDYEPGEVIVRLNKQGASLTSQGSVAEKFGAKIVERFDMGSVYKNFDGELVRMELPEGVTVAEAMAAMKDDPNVAYAEPNFVSYLEAGPKGKEVSSSQAHEQAWGLHNEGQTGGTVDVDIDAPEAWAKYDGPAKADAPLIAVIDTGIDYTHSEIKDNIAVNTGEIAGDGIDNDGNGVVDDVYGYNAFADSGDPMDGHGHGTHCTGTIAGQEVGVNKKAQVFGVKIFDDSGRTNSAAILRGINYATKRGARITSNSWGGGGASQATKEAFESSPALHFMAAGNSYRDNDQRPNYPSSYEIPNNIAVAATDHNDAKAGFSQYGKVSVDIGAPGVDVYSSIPGEKYASWSGTSMATPHAAGVGYFLASAFPELSNAELKQAIYEGVDKTDGMSDKVATGGRLNLNNAFDIAEKLAAEKAEQEAHIAK